MSCISFLSPKDRKRLRSSTNDGQPLSSFTSPEVTEGKRRRLRQLAFSTDPKIRESAALAYHCPSDVLERLTQDPEVGVRCCAARNSNTPAEMLAQLAADPSAGVRGWVAANPSASPEVLDLLTNDESPVVRDLVTWARQWER